LIRRAKRVGDFLGAECFAVAVHTKKGAGHRTFREREAISRHLNFARRMRIKAQVLKGKEPAQVLIDFARDNQITQIFLARAHERRRLFFWQKGLLQRIVRLAGDMQVVIVSEREPAKQ
jgi:two-component system, OmpR family, sensor histidine kinase KdpD